MTDGLDADDMVRARVLDELEMGAKDETPEIELSRVRAEVEREGGAVEVSEREAAEFEEERRRPCSSYMELRRGRETVA